MSKGFTTMEHTFQTPTDEIAFETFCTRLLRVHWPNSDPQLYGRRGQRQDGVDIIDESGIEPLRAAQCKFRKPGQLLTLDEVAAEVEKTKQFTPPIGAYWILTTSERSTDVQREIVRINQQHRSLDVFRVTLLTWDRIEELLRENRELWSLCIAPPVQQAIEPVHRDVQAIGVRLDTLVKASVEDQYDARLESARQRIEEHDWQAAKVVLRQLRSNRWSELSEPQRFLTLTYLAKVAYAQGDWHEAGRMHVDAKQHQPDQERAQINEALGYDLLGQTEIAYPLARELADRYPNSARPWMLITHTAPDEMTAEQLATELPPHAESDAEVLVGLAVRAIRRREWDIAEGFGQRAVKAQNEWAAAWLVLAQARLQRLIAAGFKPASGPLVTECPSDFREVIQLFDHAVERAEDEDNTFLTVQALLERGRAKRISGNLAGADDDIARAYQLEPHDAEVVFLCGNHFFHTNRVDAAFPRLRESVTLGAGGDAKATLALAIGNDEKDERRTEWLRLLLDAASDPDASLRFDAARLAVDYLVDSGRADEASEFINELVGKGLPLLAGDALRAIVAAAQVGAEGALRAAALVSNQFTASTDIQIVRLLAETLSRLGDQATALPLWQRVVEQTKQIADAWQLVETALRLKRYDLVRRLCQRWREAGVHDSRLLDAELTVLEHFAPNEALELLAQQVEQHPENSLLRLGLSRLALQLDRPELACGDASKLPPPGQVGVENGSTAVHLLVELKKFDEALRYGYDLLRANQNTPEANLTLAWLVMHAGLPDRLLSPPDKVILGAAISFAEEAVSDLQWRVIDDHPSGPAFPEDLAPEHGLAKRLLGLRVGDVFVLAGDEVDGRRARIREIVTKYVYRARKCLDEWQIRFPAVPAVEVFRIGTAENETQTQIPNLMPIIRRTHARRRHVNEILKTYREMPASIEAVARATGTHFVDAMVHLARSEENAIRCCDNRLGAFEEAVRYAKGASVVVLDLSAIVTLTLLGLDDRLGQLPVPLVVSSETMLELRKLREQHRDHQKTKGWVLPTDDGLGIRFIDSSQDQQQAERAHVEQLLERISHAASILDCAELADVSPDQRDELIDLCGQHAAESVVLARRPGHVLWSDDFVTALVGQHSSGVRRVWTQAVLANLASQGFVTARECHDASARLIGYGFISTRFDAETLFAAAELAQWAPGVRPLKQALEALSSKDDAMGKLAISSIFIARILKQPIRLPRHGIVVMAVLDRIADGACGIAGVEALRRNLSRLLGLDVGAAREAEEYVNRWFAARRLRAGIVH